MKLYYVALHFPYTEAITSILRTRLGVASTSGWSESFSFSLLFKLQPNDIHRPTEDTLHSTTGSLWDPCNYTSEDGQTGPLGSSGTRGAGPYILDQQQFRVWILMQWLVGLWMEAGAGWPAHEWLWSGGSPAHKSTHWKVVAWPARASTKWRWACMHKHACKKAGAHLCVWACQVDVVSPTQMHPLRGSDPHNYEQMGWEQEKQPLPSSKQQQVESATRSIRNHRRTGNLVPSGGSPGIISISSRGWLQVPRSLGPCHWQWHLWTKHPWQWCKQHPKTIWGQQHRWCTGQQHLSHREPVGEHKTQATSEAAEMLTTCCPSGVTGDCSNIQAARHQ